MSATHRFEKVREWQQQRSAGGWWHSFELPDGSVVQGVCSLDGLKNRIAQFPIPLDLRGKRVLDIGAWDGWFSFEMEGRGAKVVAIDCWDNPRFHEMHSLLGSDVEYLEMDVYDLSPERIGKFDIVLFMGVLYHLKHPLLALERVCSVTKGMAAVDSFVLHEDHRPGADADRRPIMEFYETDEFGGQTDNWVAPSIPCLTAFCRTAGFARVEFRNTLEYSACIACYRNWEQDSSTPSEAPVLMDAFHHMTFGINFDTRRDEYVTCVFDSPHRQLGLDEVKPDVSGYGVRPIKLRPHPEGGWQCSFKLPPGVEPGWHSVRVRVKDSLPSNGREIAVDVPVGKPDLHIAGVADGAAWTPGKIDLRKGRTLAIWVQGLPLNADRYNMRVHLGDRRLQVSYVEGANEAGNPRQVNALVPEYAPTGVFEMTVAAGEGRSHPQAVEVIK